MTCATYNKTTILKLRQWNGLLVGFLGACMVALMFGCGGGSDGYSDTIDTDPNGDLARVACELELDKCLISCDVICSPCYDAFDACMK